MSLHRYFLEAAAVAALLAPVPVRAASIVNVAIGGSNYARAGCPGFSGTTQSQVIRPVITNDLFNLSTVSNGTCPASDGIGVVAVSATATTIIDPSTFGVRATMETNGISTGGGANAEISAQVELDPPPGFTGNRITFSAGSTYSYTINANGSLGAFGLVVVGLFINDSPITSALLNATSPGTVDGILDTPEMTLRSPFVFDYAVVVSAGAANGGAASVTDPISFNLPPGWTYTLSTPPLSSLPPLGTPEPANWLLCGIGLVLLQRAPRLSGRPRSGWRSGWRYSSTKRNPRVKSL